MPVAESPFGLGFRASEPRQRLRLSRSWKVRRLTLSWTDRSEPLAFPRRTSVRGSTLGGRPYVRTLRWRATHRCAHRLVARAVLVPQRNHAFDLRVPRKAP